MRVLVETHADDAYLSLGAFVREWAADAPLMIVTVFSGDRARARDAERYADEVGAEWIGLGRIEAKGGNGDGVADLDGLDEDLRTLARTGVVMIGPLGIGHAEHRGVAEALPAGSFRYVDLPVGGRRKSRPEVAALTANRTVDALRITTARDYADHALFKTQGLFMHRNPPPALAGLPQLVVR